MATKVSIEISSGSEEAVGDVPWAEVEGSAAVLAE
jgi:hypothetical protein